MVAVVGILTAAVAITWLRLDRTNAELKITQASLSSQESLNVVLQSTNEDLRRDIVGLESDIDDLEGEIDGLEENVTILEVGKARLELTVQGLEAANSELTGERDEAISRRDALLVDKEQLTTDLAVSSNNNERLLETNEGLLSDLSEARAENDNLQASNRELSGDLEVARSDYMALQSAVGTVEELQSTADGVRGEIVELEDMLRPLILSWDSRTTGSFFCTGSMEPTLGCLDSVTWITEFEPSMIVEGTIISFNPNCWETHADKDDVNTAHRVIDIKFEDDVYHFWPRGDGNEEDDGCWIPHGNVEGYAVEFFPNRYPQNGKLRLAVLNARDTYRTIRDEYRVLYLRYCGFPVTDGRICTLPNHQYREVDGLWDDVKAALTSYDCWTEVARQSERPGHIPEHTCKDQREADSV